jgi:two-component system OmpR family sensor kinase
VSLRRRLIAGTLVLLVAGILTTDLVTSSSLRSFLYGRLDEQIDVAQDTAYAYISTTYRSALAAGVQTATTNQDAWLAELAQPRTETGGLPTTAGSPTTAGLPTTANTIPTGQSPTATSTPSTGTPARTSAPVGARRTRLNADVLAARLTADVYVEVIDNNGRVVFQRPSGSSAVPDPAPILPKILPVQASPPAHQFGSHHGAYVPDRPAFDVAAQGNQATYRVEAVSLPGGTLVTAVTLAPTNATLASLIHVEVIVSIVVVIALLVLALWIVRFGLRPLEEMTETAGAIAAGDLTQRVRSPEERGEVGRLGSALNGMLSQIEAAFAERTSTESRLRRFVADASHELRTPLTSIRGYAELLRKGALADEDARHRAAERIEHEASRMGLLVDDLLLLARLDQRRPLERSHVDLGGVVRDAVEAARAVDSGRRISLEVPELVLVDGDAARLRQVIDNLLHNAALHTPPGTPVDVAVRLHGSLAILTVADEGPGLAADQAEHLFDRFYRGSEARTGEGTGLGLSIVAALATAHDGRAFVHSVPGQGTVFTVELPAAESQRTAAGGPAAPDEKAPLAASSPWPAPSPSPPDPSAAADRDAVDRGSRPVRH